MKTQKSSVENFQFILVGLMLILGGLQHGNYPVIRSFLIVLGVFLIIYALYTLISRKRNAVLKLFALTGEFIALIAAAFVLFRNGSNYLHLLYLLAAVGIAIAIGIHSFKIYKNKNNLN